MTYTREEIIKDLKEFSEGSKDARYRMSTFWKDVLELLEQKRWNNHQVACLLADMFGDTCACNYNSIDKWLPELCDFKDTCCPNPVGVACWEQFLKHSQARYCD